MPEKLCTWCWLRPQSDPGGPHAGRCEPCATQTYDQEADQHALLARAGERADWLFIELGRGEELGRENLEAKTVLVWRFQDAPWWLRCLSTHGGDEDWVLLAPPGYERTIWWADSGTPFGCCRVDDIELPGGFVVMIGAHA